MGGISQEEEEDEEREKRQVASVRSYLLYHTDSQQKCWGPGCKLIVTAHEWHCEEVAGDDFHLVHRSRNFNTKAILN